MTIKWSKNTNVCRSCFKGKHHNCSGSCGPQWLGCVVRGHVECEPSSTIIQEALHHGCLEFDFENVGKKALIRCILYGKKCVGRDFWNHLRACKCDLNCQLSLSHPDVKNGNTGWEFRTLWKCVVLHCWHSIYQWEERTYSLSKEWKALWVKGWDCWTSELIPLWTSEKGCAWEWQYSLGVQLFTTMSNSI